MTRIRLSAPESAANPGFRDMEPHAFELGEPLDVKQVAKMIGCSVWTVRQRHLPKNGLPCLRSAPSGKLIFYRDQVIRWILQRQQNQKGGKGFGSF